MMKIWNKFFFGGVALILKKCLEFKLPFKVIFRMSYTIHEIYFCVKKIILYV